MNRHVELQLWREEEGEKNNTKGILIRAHYGQWTRQLIHMNSLRVLQMVHHGIVFTEATPHS